MEITKKEFQAYEAVRASGVTNMWDGKRVSRLSRLPKDKILEIMRTYEDLMIQYPDVRQT